MDPDQGKWNPTATLLVLAGLFLFHVAWAVFEPEPAIWGDEHLYQRLGTQDLTEATILPLPGTLRFEHRPQLGSRVLAMVSAGSDSARAMYLRWTAINLFMIVGVAFLTGCLTRLAGASRRAALFAIVLVATQPFLGFHVHSLWPEVLHSWFLVCFLCACTWYLWRPSFLVLTLAGVSAGWAMLAKSVVTGFLPVCLLFLMLSGLVENRKRSKRTGGDERRGLARNPWIATAVFLLSMLFIIGPQLFRNYQDGYGLRLSANRWWNIELGVVPSFEEHTRPTVRRAITARYKDAAALPGGREVEAKRRVLTVVRERGPVATATHQVKKAVSVTLTGYSSLESSVFRRERWGSPPPSWLVAVAHLGRIVWLAALFLAAFGLVFQIGSGLRSLFLAAFLAYMFGGFLLVPLKHRFLIPAVPILSLFAGIALDRLWSILARKIKKS